MHHLKKITILFLFFVFQFTISQKRILIPLNENWLFKKAPNEKKDLTTDGWSKVNIPHSWNSKDMQLGKDFYEGSAYYKKSITIPKSWKNKRVFIRFEGAGQIADVICNNTYVGKHKGSYAAFIFELTPFLKIGVENEILVKVNNAAKNDIIPVNHFLFGIYGGIYRPVKLIVTDKLNISTTDYASSGVYIKQKKVSAKSADIHIETKLENKYFITKKVDLKTSVFTENDGLIFSKINPIKVKPQGRQSFFQEFTIKNPHLWNGKKDPFLYKVVVQVLDEKGLVIDEVTQPLGIRKYEIKSNKGFYLNDKKYEMYGVCRHQDRWNYGNAISNKHHKEDLNLMDEIGATTLRLAHYQQSEYIYAKSDSIGFIVWAEIPFVNKVKKQEAENAKLQLTELIKQNFNHPSIFTWGLHNEVWAKTTSDYAPVLTQELHDIAKTLDPNRYTVAVSDKPNLKHPINLHANIQGVNRYYGWYQGKSASDLSLWIDDLKNNFPDHNVILAEYGIGANIYQQTDTITTLPNRVINPKGQYFPESYANRAHETQWGIIKNQNYLVASYIWNMFDFGLPLWSRGGIPARNHKGLVTYDRKHKKDVFYWYKANWNSEPMVYISDRKAVNRTQKKTIIHVYCNTADLELFVNDKKIKKHKTGVTNVHFIYENITLKKGKNTIIAKVKIDGKTLADKVIWNLK